MWRTLTFSCTMSRSRPKQHTNQFKPAKLGAKSLLSYSIFCANSVSPPHGDLHLIFIDDQIGSGENVWDDTCLPLNFLLLKPPLKDI